MLGQKSDKSVTAHKETLFIISFKADEYMTKQLHKFDISISCAQLFGASDISRPRKDKGTQI
ncbi:hypothetical protein HDF08_000421 [Edaphobacter lichenicola]|uniref:Uncharacterized protein n=1 Tax=Tunturiibacter lichenicola TaxID=2051959 RepID=A0A852VD11_9BACT|nr:hypothetical protein [Edaphobacter lichenicola]